MAATHTHSVDAPRIYAACLASYNDGRLFGRWIDCAGKSGDELRIQINDMLARSPCPNVLRRKCEHCGHYQTDARPYRDNADECSHCDETLTGEFKPSAEEWAIHDHQGFAGMIGSEWADLDDVAALAEVLDGDDEDKRRGLLWLVNDRGCFVSEAIRKCGDVRTYTADAHDLAADYAQELASDVVENFEKRSQQWPFNCIDWQHAGRELKMGGDIDVTTQDGERFLVVNASDF